jgi:hypothetical protein
VFWSRYPLRLDADVALCRSAEVTTEDTERDASDRLGCRCSQSQGTRTRPAWETTTSERLQSLETHDPTAAAMSVAEAVKAIHVHLVIRNSSSTYVLATRMRAPNKNMGQLNQARSHYTVISPDYSGAALTALIQWISPNHNALWGTVVRSWYALVVVDTLGDTRSTTKFRVAVADMCLLLLKEIKSFKQV